ncbi:thermonuclease family protein [Desulfosarcina sp.]|uniref:thermonuclease family protein n=1 Tax=Desulfosarcina sp. TaxID=2027861 RepID=UPI0039710158
MARILMVLVFLFTHSSCAYALITKVLDVYDGDTLSVGMQGERVAIRLYGIDAPEAGQNGNVASTRFLRRLIHEKPVVIKVMGTDGFGWTLAIISFEGKAISVNAVIVANGYAWVNPRECRVDVCTDLKKFETQARMLKLGIWSGYDLVPPWEFKDQLSNQ